MALCAATPARAQAPAPGGGVPPALADRVAAAVAARWAVAPQAVRLDWGRRPVAGGDGRGAATLSDGAPFTLLGRGDGGWFAVVFGPGGIGVAARVRAGTLDTTAVATRPLAPGAALAEADVALVPRVRWDVPRQGRERPAAGWIVRRPVAAGGSLEPPVTAPPPLVAAGSRVRLVVTGGGVSVALDGVALQDARLGQRVLVRRDGRARPLWGTVAGPGLVRLDS